MWLYHSSKIQPKHKAQPSLSLLPTRPTLSCKAQMSITSTRFQVWYRSAVSGYFRRSSPPSYNQPVAYPRVECLDRRQGASSGSMQGFHSHPTNAVAGAGDHPGKMHVLPGARRAHSRQLGRARARGSSAPPGTGDPKQGLPDHCVGHSDACDPALDPSWLPGSISGRGGSMRCSSVHPIVSVFDQFYVAQDKQHLTKQMADCVRNL